MALGNRKALYFNLFKSFFLIGSFTFGGGFAMVPLIEKDVVEKYGWMSTEEFLDMLAVTQSAPGPIAVNAAVFIGFKLAGIPGAVCATLGVTLPSFLIIVIIAGILISQGNQEQIQKFFNGVRPAIVALILGAGLRLGKKSIKNAAGYLTAIIALLLLLLADLHPILLVIGGAALGIAGDAYLRKGKGEA